MAQNVTVDFPGEGGRMLFGDCFLWFEGYGRSFDNPVCADFFSDYLVEFQISYGECQIGTANQDLQYFTRVPKEHTFWQETKYPSLLWIPWKAPYLGPPGRLLFSRSLKMKYLALALMYWKTASGRITDIIHVFSSTRPLETVEFSQLSPSIQCSCSQWIHCTRNSSQFLTFL